MVSMDVAVNNMVKEALFFFTHMQATFSLEPP
jgi:hypothetical protein